MQSPGANFGIPEYVSGFVVLVHVQLDKVTPVNQFRHTSHVEPAARFKR
jgi:hypothetical protein